MTVDLLISPHLAETLLVAASAFLLLVYHARLLWLTRHHPEKTSQGRSNQLRREWTRNVMMGQRDILGVQTLRNWSTAASFLASTAIIINIAILNVTFQAERAAFISQRLNFIGSTSEMLWLVKLLLLTFAFFSAFFNFAISIRYYNHAGFMIDIPVGEDPDLNCDTVAAVLNRAALHYFLGMRGYYFAVPLTLWLFGPLWMLAGSVLITLVLHHLDRTL